MLPHLSPDEVAAADLAEACQHEQPADDEQQLHSAPPACSAHGLRVWATRGASSDSILRMGKRGGAHVSEENKAMVQRLVEGINAGDIEGTVDELFALQAARRVKRLFTGYHSAFPAWHEEIIELVAEEDTVAGRFKRSGTHRGEFLGDDSQLIPPIMPIVRILKSSSDSKFRASRLQAYALCPTSIGRWSPRQRAA